jgi:hypothetical protein
VKIEKWLFLSEHCARLPKVDAYKTYIDAILNEQQKGVEDAYIINHISLERIFKYKDEFLNKTKEALCELFTENKIANMEHGRSDPMGNSNAPVFRHKPVSSGEDLIITHTY